MNSRKMSGKEPDHFNGYSVAALLRKMQEEPSQEPLIELRNKRSIHLYEGFHVDPTALKLACLLFDHVTTTELTLEEIEYLTIS